MRPVAGAIERIVIDEDMQISVIGESLPRGICGSGLIELAGGLLKAGVINQQGDFADSSSLENTCQGLAKRLIITEQGKSFLLYRDEGEFASDIYVTQDDIQALMRSKAYLAAAIRLLLQKAGISFKTIKKVLMGGAFGYHIDPQMFISIGLIPVQLSGSIFFVGNTSKTGAHLALIDKSVLGEAEQIARSVQCFDPQQEPQFETMVQEAHNFKPLL
jgi:uncharacterized 2Fe-2S/4Fe-4S cluster protein (DUF4445 family)